MGTVIIDVREKDEYAAAESALSRQRINSLKWVLMMRTRTKYIKEESLPGRDRVNW